MNIVTFIEALTSKEKRELFALLKLDNSRNEGRTPIVDWAKMKYDECDISIRLYNGLITGVKELGRHKYVEELLTDQTIVLKYKNIGKKSWIMFMEEVKKDFPELTSHWRYH